MQGKIAPLSVEIAQLEKQIRELTTVRDSFDRELEKLRAEQNPKFLKAYLDKKNADRFRDFCDDVLTVLVDIFNVSNPFINKASTAYMGVTGVLDLARTSQQTDVKKRWLTRFFELFNLFVLYVTTYFAKGSYIVLSSISMSLNAFGILATGIGLIRRLIHYTQAKNELIEQEKLLVGTVRAASDKSLQLLPSYLKYLRQSMEFQLDKLKELQEVFFQEKRTLAISLSNFIAKLFILAGSITIAVGATAWVFPLAIVGSTALLLNTAIEIVDRRMNFAMANWVGDKFNQIKDYFYNESNAPVLPKSLTSHQEILASFRQRAEFQEKIPAQR